MNLDEFNRNNNTELTFPENIVIASESFKNIINIIKETLQSLGVDTEGLQIYYERHLDATSILAIQLHNGDYDDKANYMLNGCKAWISENRIDCDVFLHADAKIAQISIKVAGRISRNIVEFFEEVEKELRDNELSHKKISLTIPLEIVQEQEQTWIKRLIKRLGKRWELE